MARRVERIAPRWGACMVFGTRGYAGAENQPLEPARVSLGGKLGAGWLGAAGPAPGGGGRQKGRWLGEGQVRRVLVPAWRAVAVRDVRPQDERAGRHPLDDRRNPDDDSGHHVWQHDAAPGQAGAQILDRALVHHGEQRARLEADYQQALLGRGARRLALRPRRRREQSAQWHAAQPVALPARGGRHRRAGVHGLGPVRQHRAAGLGLCAVRPEWRRESQARHAVDHRPGAARRPAQFVGPPRPVAAGRRRERHRREL